MARPSTESPASSTHPDKTTPAADAPAIPILVADDDPVCRRLMRSFLEQSHYTPVLCEDGSSAMQLLTGDKPPQIAILDWMMPDITGPDVCTRIRAAKLAIDPYLIILTAKREKAELAQALDAGADDFLTKPFNIVELSARLKVAERAIQRQARLQAEIHRLRHGRQEDPHYTALLRSALEQAVENLRIGPLREEHSDGVRDQAVWSAIIFPEEKSWLDILTEVEPLHGLPSSEIGWQLHQAMIDVIRLEYPTILSPFIAKTTSLRPEGAAQHQGFVTPQNTIRVTSLRSSSTAQRLTVHQLHTGDVLAEAYPPATVQEVPLLKRGATLNNRIIERLMEYAHTIEQAPPVQVFRLSGFAHKVF